jgi:alpha-1,2-mannosyltransferase
VGNHQGEGARCSARHEDDTRTVPARLRERHATVRMPALSMTHQRLRLACFVASLITLAVQGWDLSRPGLLDRTGRLKGPDFLQFYTYGALVRDGRAQHLYNPQAHADIARERIDPRMTLTGFRPNYSPVVAWLMMPFSALPFLQAYAAWCAVSGLLYALAVVLVTRCGDVLRLDRVTVALAASAFPAAFVVVRYGQISAVSLVILAITVWLHSRARRFAAGLVLGALAYKPNLLVVPVLALMAARQWRLLAGLATGIVIEIAIDGALVGREVLSEYIQALATIAMNPDLVQAYPTESHSARGFVRLLLAWRPALVATTVMALAVCVWAVAAVWRRSNDLRLRWASLTLATLIATPHLLTYDLVLLAVPLILLVDWCLRTGGTVPAGSWRVGLLLLFGAAWPGTLLARLYGVQLSTLGMGLVLWLVVDHSARPTASATTSSSSMRPIISS